VLKVVCNKNLGERRIVKSLQCTICIDLSSNDSKVVEHLFGSFFFNWFKFLKKKKKKMYGFAFFTKSLCYSLIRPNSPNHLFSQMV
jgi:hypothetical protein